MNYGGGGGGGVSEKPKNMFSWHPLKVAINLHTPTTEIMYVAMKYSVEI